MTGKRKGTGVQIGHLMVMGGSGKQTVERVLEEFLRQGQRAAVDRILAAERKRRPRPKGRA